MTRGHWDEGGRMTVFDLLGHGHRYSEGITEGKEMSIPQRVSVSRW